jgi:hypothetical protein
MFDVFQTCLTTEKVKLLVNHYNEKCDAQSVYRDLKKYALASTAAILAGDTLVDYIITT